jgi:biopolymer transport protein ExbD
VEPDQGRAQTLPRSEPEPKKDKQSQNIEVELTRDAVIINGTPLPRESFAKTVILKLADKTRDEDRIVAVKSRKEVPYSHWMDITGIIEDAGGVITLQLEEEQTVQVQ